MKVLIVGGGRGKESGVINKLQALFDCNPDVDYCLAINGYNPKHAISLAGYDLVLWWPDIKNALIKKYPTKDQGSVLICSKVMREGRTRIDAVSRIFKMRGNAVVSIEKIEGAHGSVFQFELIDALNNTWRKTTSLPKLVDMTLELYKWTKDSVRVSLKKNDLPLSVLEGLDYTDMAKFVEINKELALKVAEGCGNRFFGNFSTRCTKLFPSTRKGKDLFFFSPRNVDKRAITLKDLVLTDMQYYYDERKPSVDTPVQLELYSALPGINWMIHGHAYIKGAPMTDFYCPCGDLREVDEVVQVVSKTATTRVNLLNHGFLLMGAGISNMQKHLDECEFKMIGGDLTHDSSSKL